MAVDSEPRQSLGWLGYCPVKLREYHRWMSLRWRSVVVLGVLLASTGCGDTPRDTSGASSLSPRPAPPTPSSVFDVPVVDNSFAVDPDGTRLAIRCWGSGSPVVIMEGGSGEGGLGRWEGNPVTEALARRTEVCAYDRAGAGESDAAPNHARGLDDVVADLHALLREAGVGSPYLMAGVSGGGFYAFHYAGRYPAQVAGVVMIETPAGQVKMSATDVKELAWDSPGNSEHVDYVTVEHQMAVARLPINPIPVTVVTGRFGQSAGALRSQRVWLEGASLPRQVILETGHDVDVGDSDGLTQELLATFEAAQRR